jgi:hypothetical protein
LFIVPAIFLRFGRTATLHHSGPARQSDNPSTNGQVATNADVPAPATA